jgi:hypothetical protein
MKVYFTGSLHNKDIDKSLYKKIVGILEKSGHEVNSSVLKTSKEELDALRPKERRVFYRSMKKAMQKSEVVIIEGSYPSTINIGHELSLALDLGKPIVCLYQPHREPGIIQGIETEKLIMLEYTENDVERTLKYGLEEAGEVTDVRFNFFISPQQQNYLDFIAKNDKVPRAVYLRGLIDKAMAKDEEYN